VNRKNLVVRVSQERWQQAQAWELHLWRHSDRLRIPALLLRTLGWRREGLEAGDDWNEWWAARFGHYRTLPTSIPAAIELGCGPYTNMRIICRGRQINRAYCSDPLVRHYAGFRWGWLSRAYRQCKILIDDHPAEELPFADGVFDLTVMINVLDHVRDALVVSQDKSETLR
jgi:hypothetical protein